MFVKLSEMELFSRQRPASHSTKILRHLKKSGMHGAYNHELARVGGLSWHRRIGDLRKDGHNIQCLRLNHGLYKYYLIKED